MKFNTYSDNTPEAFDSIAVEIRKSPASDCNFVLTILLCFFFGVFGIHRFYAGKIGTGILMLLTFGGFGIWATVDFLMLVFGQFYDKKNLLIRLKADGDDNEKQLSPCSFPLTIILCFFFGVFGVHRFYTGKIVTGILMFFTLGGFFVWKLIDFIIIISGGFKDKNGLLIKPLSAINYKF